MMCFGSPAVFADASSPVLVLSALLLLLLLGGLLLPLLLLLLPLLLPLLILVSQGFAHAAAQVPLN